MGIAHGPTVSKHEPPRNAPNYYLPNSSNVSMFTRTLSLYIEMMGCCLLVTNHDLWMSVIKMTLINSPESISCHRTYHGHIPRRIGFESNKLVVMSQNVYQYFGDLGTATFMMTSSNANIFRVTVHLCGEFTGPRWIPHTKASDAELWCLLWSAPE